MAFTHYNFNKFEVEVRSIYANVMIHISVFQLWKCCKLCFVDFVVYTLQNCLHFLETISKRYFDQKVIFNHNIFLFHHIFANKSCTLKKHIDKYNKRSLRATRRDLHLSTNYQQLNWKEVHVFEDDDVAQNSADIVRVVLYLRKNVKMTMYLSTK